MNDELSRLSFLANQGQAVQRILVLDPQTTGYCRARKADATALPRGGAVNPASGTGALQSLDGLRLPVIHLAQALSDRLFDFDIGDEYILEEFGRARGKRLAVGSAWSGQRYGACR